ncbi:hypothetical protein OAO01_05690 [Oligoflexia bacterium]|nr:hypothetical protein [Oligoflexia bacterium]
MKNSSAYDRGLFYNYTTLRAAIKRKVPGSWWQQFLAVAGLICLIVVSSLLWMEVSKRFPFVPTGSYLGSVYGVFGEGSDGPTELYLERASDGSDLFFALFRTGWPPQVIANDLVTEESGGKWLYPITLIGEHASLRFIGNRVEVGRFAGTVRNLNTGAEGTWKADLISENSAVAAPEDTDNTLLWLHLKSELDDLNVEIETATQRVAEQKQEIEYLTEVITEGEALKLTGKDKFVQASQALSKANAVLAEKRTEAKALERKVALSERVTKMGKLVLLSREALERDNRWIDSMLKAPADRTSTDLKLAVTKGEEILKLKRDLALEKERVSELEHRLVDPSGRTKVPTGAAAFDSLWR